MRGIESSLVVGDYFTKWVEAYALPNQEASTCAEKLVSELFSRFGVPRQLHSDQGRNFESSLFAQMCKILGIEKTRTTPFHPRSDGMVERFNKTLTDMLAKMIDPTKAPKRLGRIHPIFANGLPQLSPRIYRRNTQHDDARPRGGTPDRPHRRT